MHFVQIITPTLNQAQMDASLVGAGSHLPPKTFDWTRFI